MRNLEQVAKAIARVEGQVIGEAFDFAEWHWEEFIDHAKAAIAAMPPPPPETSVDGVPEIHSGMEMKP